MTCRRLAPIARSSAISPVRCATMIEKVLKMMNAPTNKAMNANTSNAVRKNPRASCNCFACSLTTSDALTASMPFGTKVIQATAAFDQTYEVFLWKARAVRRDLSKAARTLSRACHDSLVQTYGQEVFGNLPNYHAPFDQTTKESGRVLNLDRDNLLKVFIDRTDGCLVRGDGLELRERWPGSKAWWPEQTFYGVAWRAVDRFRDTPPRTGWIELACQA